MNYKGSVPGVQVEAGEMARGQISEGWQARLRGLGLTLRQGGSGKGFLKKRNNRVHRDIQLRLFPFSMLKTIREQIIYKIMCFFSSSES